MGLIIYFYFLKSKKDFIVLQEQEHGSLSEARINGFITELGSVTNLIRVPSSWYQGT
jgi:hypothetical protein